MREIEIKLKAPDLGLIVSKLEKLGCVISKPIHQKDINFIHKDDLKWFEPTIEEWVYPRLRIQDGKPLTFTVKKPLKNEMDCREHELHIDDADELRGALELFGYKEGITVEKIRHTCAYKDYTITLDEVKHLGNFIEIERVVTDGDAERIQEEMFAFARATFGLEKDSTVMKGYDILMHHFLQKK